MPFLLLPTYSFFRHKAVMDSFNCMQTFITPIDRFTDNAHVVIEGIVLNTEDIQKWKKTVATHGTVALEITVVLGGDHNLAIITKSNSFEVDIVGTFLNFVVGVDQGRFWCLLRVIAREIMVNMTICLCSACYINYCLH